MNISISDAISEFDIFDGIGESTRQQLTECARTESFEQGEILFSDHDQIRSLYVVERGQVCLYELSRQGAKKIIFLCRKGDVLNETVLQDPKAGIGCEAMLDTVVLKFPRDELIRLANRDAVLAAALYNSMAVKLRVLYRQLRNSTAGESADRRLAAKLYYLAESKGNRREDGSIEIRMKLNGTILAEMVGASRETVSRQMSKLVEDGCVIRHSGYIRVSSLVDLKNYYYYGSSQVKGNL
jgi:CRP/FNR family cyclic AMP-dependent transcriptional regulator